MFTLWVFILKVCIELQVWIQNCIIWVYDFANDPEPSLIFPQQCKINLFWALKYTFNHLLEWIHQMPFKRPNSIYFHMWKLNLSFFCILWFKEHSITCNDLNRSQGRYAKWEKLTSKGWILSNSIYITPLKWQAMEIERTFSTVKVRGWRWLSLINNTKRVSPYCWICILVMVVVTEIYTQDKIARSNVHTLVTARQTWLKTEQSLQSVEQFCTNIHFLVLILYCRSNDDMSPLGK